MRVLPAIDLKDGRCVRLKKGDFDTVHTVAEDAAQTARSFLAAGAKLIHMVDLDGAKDGSRQNYSLVRQVLSAGAAVELGGGIRTLGDIESALLMGVSRVVLGSAAAERPELVREACEKYGEKIAVGIDALGGRVKTRGWLKDGGWDYLEFARLVEGYGAKTVIFTDIDRDGMLSGPNFEQLEALREAVNVSIVASGGVSCLADITRLKAMGIDEVIAGKAVYAGKIDLAEAIREAQG